MHPIRIVIVHIDLIAQGRNFLAAPLMESIVTLIAVESGEEEPATAFTEGQSEECFADELEEGTNLLFKEGIKEYLR